MFCHECGVRNDASALFCPECGTPVRQRATVPPPATSDSGDARPLAAPSPAVASSAARTTRNARRGWVAGGVAVLVVALAGAAWWGLRPPSADAQMLATALTHPAVLRTQPAPDTLCIANGIRYDTRTLSVVASNQQTIAWMDTLATLGLYTASSPAEESTGLFGSAQAVRRYTPTDELASWARSGRLCVARGVEAGPVNEVEAPRKEDGPTGESLQTVRAHFSWVATTLAPWAQRPEAAHVLEQLRDWKMVQGRLQQDAHTGFVRDGRRWISAAEYLAKPELLARQQGGSTGRSGSTAEPSPPASQPSLWNKLGGLLGGNPLLGEWEVDDPNMPQGLPSEVGRLRFTRDAMETAGSLMKVNYEVRDGEVVVMHQDSPGAGMRIKIEGDRLWWNMGVMTVQFKRKS